MLKFFTRMERTRKYVIGFFAFIMVLGMLVAGVYNRPASVIANPFKSKEVLAKVNGDEVTVAVNGSSVEARIAIRERMREGAAFLIEGTDEGNGNLLANGAPRAIEVSKR